MSFRVDRKMKLALAHAEKKTGKNRSEILNAILLAHLQPWVSSNPKPTRRQQWAKLVRESISMKGSVA